MRADVNTAGILALWLAVSAGPLPARAGNESFTAESVTNDMAIAFDWTTQNLVRAVASVNGSVSGATNTWVDQGSNATVAAIPAPYHGFDRWDVAEGVIPPGSEGNPDLAFAPAGPVSLTARFKELRTAAGTPLWWLTGLYGAGESDDLLDLDNDGHLTWQEYVARTNPRDPDDRFTLTIGPDGAVAVPDSKGDRFYSVSRAASADGPYGAFTNFWGSDGRYSVASGCETNARSFYRGEVRLGP